VSLMICPGYYGSCIALLGAVLNIAYGYVLISRGNALMRRVGEVHVFDTLMGFLMYIVAVLMMSNEDRLIGIVLGGLNLKVGYVTHSVDELQCSVVYPYHCVTVKLTTSEPIINPGAASLVFGNMANALIRSMTQLYVAEVTLTLLPFVSPVGYYLNDISRYFTWQAEWALMNTYMLYYLSIISSYASQLAALGASLIPIRQVRWVGGLLFSLGLVTPIYVVAMANWLASQNLTASINPSLINDIKGILSLGTNLFNLGGRLEEFNVVTDVSMAIYSSMLYGLSRVLGGLGLSVDV